MAARPTAFAQLIVMGSGLVLFPLSFVLASVVERRRFRGWGLVCVSLPLSVPLLFFLAVRIGGLLRDGLFDRDLPKLERIVQVSESRVATTGESTRIPVATADVSGPVWARRGSDGILTVTIFVGGGFPVKHLAYIYRSDDTFPAELSKSWPKMKRRQQKWFEVSD